MNNFRILIPIQKAPNSLGNFDFRRCNLFILGTEHVEFRLRARLLKINQADLVESIAFLEIQEEYSGCQTIKLEEVGGENRREDSKQKQSSRKNSNWKEKCASKKIWSGG